MKKTLITLVTLGLIVSCTACKDNTDRNNDDVSSKTSETVSVASNVESLEEPAMESSEIEVSNENSQSDSSNENSQTDVLDESSETESTLNPEDIKEAFDSFSAEIKKIDKSEGGIFSFVYDNSSLDKTADLFAEFTQKNREEFLNMSIQERYIWLSLSLRAKEMTDIRPVKSLDEWNQWVLTSLKHGLSRYDKSNGTNVSELYEEVMEWSYEYYAETGEIFNFVDTFSD